jgi:hypothetical protein
VSARRQLRAAGAVGRAWGTACAGCARDKYFPAARSASHARELLAAAGWTFARADGWTCPTCVERARRVQLLEGARASAPTIGGAP